MLTETQLRIDFRKAVALVTSEILGGSVVCPGGFGFSGTSFSGNSILLDKYNIDEDMKHVERTRDMATW